MQVTKGRRTLAIDPGTRYMGVAVLDGDNLVHHGVVSLRKGGSPHERLREARGAVLTLIRDFGPAVLAVETAFFANNRNTALLNILVDEVQAVGRRRGLGVVAYAPSTIKRRIAGNGRANKRDVAEAVVRRFPDLRPYLSEDGCSRARYHSNMFDAVAVGIVAGSVTQAFLNPRRFTRRDVLS